MEDSKTSLVFGPLLSLSWLCGARRLMMRCQSRSVEVNTGISSTPESPQRRNIFNARISSPPEYLQCRNLLTEISSSRHYSTSQFRRMRKFRNLLNAGISSTPESPHPPTISFQKFPNIFKNYPIPLHFLSNRRRLPRNCPGFTAAKPP